MKNIYATISKKMNTTNEIPWSLIKDDWSACTTSYNVLRLTVHCTVYNVHTLYNVQCHTIYIIIHTMCVQCWDFQKIVIVQYNVRAMLRFQKNCHCLLDKDIPNEYPLTIVSPDSLAVKIWRRKITISLSRTTGSVHLQRMYMQRTMYIVHCTM